MSGIVNKVYCMQYLSYVYGYTYTYIYSEWRGKYSEHRVVEGSGRLKGVENNGKL